MNKLIILRYAIAIMKDLTSNFTINKWSEEDLMEAAKRDLNEDPAKTEEDLKTIKSWISKCPHLHTIKHQAG